LPKQSRARIPWAVLAIEQPAPACVIAVEKPEWLSKRTREMRHGRIDSNQQIQVFKCGGRIGKIAKVIGKVEYTSVQRTSTKLFDCRFPLLKTYKLAIGLIEQRGKLIEGHATLVIDAACADYAETRISGPDQSNAWLCSGAKALSPLFRFVLRRGQIW